MPVLDRASSRATEEDTTLIFESRFESGSLRQATQLDAWEYDLIQRSDVSRGDSTIPLGGRKARQF